MKGKKQIISFVNVSIKTVISLFPTPLSGFFDALFGEIKENVLQKRAEKWKNDIVERLGRLEDKYESLISNETFATALIKTSELAIKTGNDEKRKLFANCLVNSFLLNAEEEKTILLLNILDKCSFLHINIIKYLHDEYLTTRLPFGKSTRIINLLQLKFNEIERPYLLKAIKDLQNDYLIETFVDGAQVEMFGVRTKLLTKLGYDFYTFLKDIAKEEIVNDCI